jgi:hypothetical protein
MEKGLTISLLTILISCGLIGCGTLLGSKQQVSVDSNPPNAEIINEGRMVDKTPGVVNLDTNDPSTHRIIIRKEGFKEEVINPSTSTDYSVVFWDVILGGVPLLVDLALGNLDYFEKDIYTLNLRTITENKDSSKNAEDTEKNIASVFGDEESDNDADTNDSEETSSSDADSNISLTIKNSSYDFFEGTITVLESIKGVSIKSKIYENSESVYEIDSEVEMTDLVNKIKERTEEDLKINKLSAREILLEVRK